VHCKEPLEAFKGHRLPLIEEYTIIFDVVTEEKHPSRNNRNAKKKCIGACKSAGLHIMVTMISMLLPTAAMLTKIQLFSEL
jgi:hypothetical protein